MILFFGNNGVGKTNILEALSLLGKNPSLRNASLEEMVKNDQPRFSIYLELKNHQFIENTGISFDKINKKKQIQINGEIIGPRKLADFKSYLPNFIWLTPELDSLFISGKQIRRDYLDQIVCDIDNNHLERINAYQKLLKERLAIMQKYHSSNNASKWLNIVENKIVELGIAIATARIETLDFFNKAIISFNSKFPKARLEVIGDIESKILNNHHQSLIQIEEYYLQKLEQNRHLDSISFKTNFGVHRSDFMAIFLDKNLAANLSSTGEQKSILISLTLARAKISAIYKKQPTVLIFDEIASHLDRQKKQDLLLEIQDSSLQCFFSATSSNLVPKENLEDNIEQIEIK